jgi:hypothetical protein
MALPLAGDIVLGKAFHLIHKSRLLSQKMEIILISCIIINFNRILLNVHLITIQHMLIVI